MLQVPLNTNLPTKLTFIQWLKWFCEAGAHLTKPGWNRPDIRSTHQLIWRYFGIK